MGTTKHRSPPPIFEELPSEILAKICGCFCSHCTGNPPSLWDIDITESRIERVAHRKVLLELCFVSRRVYRIAQPVLFHYFCSDSSDVGILHEYKYQTATSLVSFLRTLVQRPDLAKAVREVQFPDASFEDYPKSEVGMPALPGSSAWSDPFPEPLSTLDTALFEHLRKKLGLQPFDWSLCGEMITRIGRHKGNELMDLLIALVVAHTPNVKRVKLTLDSCCDLPLKGVRFLKQEWPALTSLTFRSELSYWNVGRLLPLHVASFQDIVPLLVKAPRLETLALDGFGNRGLDVEPPVFINLRQLAITYSSFSYRNLRTLLRSCPKITSFSYRTGEMYYPAVDMELGNWNYLAMEVSPAEVISLLEPLVTTLKSLSLYMHGALFFSKPEAAVRSLKQFVALERLDIDYQSSLTGYRRTLRDLEDVLGEDFESGNITEQWEDTTELAPPGEHLVELLPTSLQFLRLRGCGYDWGLVGGRDMYEDIERLVQEARPGGGLPCLKEVNFRGWDALVDLDEEHVLEEMRALRRLFKNSSVILQVDKDPNIHEYVGEAVEDEVHSGWQDSEFGPPTGLNSSPE